MMVSSVPLFLVFLLIPVLGIPLVGLESSTHVPMDAVGECSQQILMRRHKISHFCISFESLQSL